MSRHLTRACLAGLGLPVALALASGCGVDAQAVPEAITLPPSPTSSSPAADGTPDEEIVLWFLRDGRLAATQRQPSAGETPAVLDLLAEGPTTTEVAAGLRTALLAQQPGLTVVDQDPTDPLVTVQVGQQFLSLTGTDQLPAVAQVVWTVTELPGVEQVRFATESGPLEVPTDQGLSDDAVEREDYASLAPERTDASVPPPPTAGPAPRSSVPASPSG